MEVNDIWSKTLNLLSIEIESTNYDIWIRYVIPVEIKGESIILMVPNEFTKKIVENRFTRLLQKYIYKATSLPLKVEFVISDVDYSELEENYFKPAPDEKQEFARKHNLNPKYIFDNFVSGESNELAYSASLAVANSPGVQYNPLFLCGGVGLGKTHLMQAIGNYALSIDKNKKIVYASSEKFTNEMINSIQEGKNDEFRKKYRDVDILLIDDIQFIAGKSGTQEEFFHTFNSLYQNNKQIVITSDKMPKEIPQIEERLRSRFESGLTADIQPPGLETRIAILRKKKSIENLPIDDEIITYIAKNITSNVRKLEGAMIRVNAHQSLLDRMDLEMCANILKDIINEEDKKIVTPKMIKGIVCERYDITIENMESRKRNTEYAFPRQVAMYLTRELTDISLSKIGEAFNRDHSTVIHSVEKIGSMLEEDPNLLKVIEELKGKIVE
ncbi:MAG: chromosomal replication initiator protein DnaA [Tissierellia bacterium]|nr:chromosomal replication initiator protein DnaA [Tissierellia bacterium]